MTAGEQPVARERATSGSNVHLTPRELEVLAYLKTGMSNREIATSLFLSESTVKACLTTLYAKLGVSNRTEAAIVGLEVFPMMRAFAS